MENDDLRLGHVLFFLQHEKMQYLKAMGGGGELSLPRDPFYSCFRLQMKYDDLRLGHVLLISLCIVFCNMKKLNGERMDDCTALATSIPFSVQM